MDLQYTYRVVPSEVAFSIARWRPARVAPRGGRLRPDGGGGCGAHECGPGQGPALRGGQGRDLRHLGRPRARSRGGVLPLADRALHRERGGGAQPGDEAHLALEPALHRPRGCGAPEPRSARPQPRAGQGPLQRGADRGLRRPGRRATDPGAPDAARGPHRARGGSRADGGGPARRARQRRRGPLGRGDRRGQRSAGSSGPRARPLSRAGTQRGALRRGGLHDRRLLGRVAQRDQRAGRLGRRRSGSRRTRHLAAAGHLAGRRGGGRRAQGVHGRGGDHLFPAPGGPRRHPRVPSEAEAVALLGAMA